jgi:hypothetical protein
VRRFSSIEELRSEMAQRLAAVKAREPTVALRF